MPSSGRHILDISKKGPSRAKARSLMRPLFKERGKAEPRTPKQSRLRARRRRQRIFMFCICLLSAAGLVGALGAATHLEHIAIKDISVQGVTALPPEALSASVSASIKDDGFKLFSRENILLYPRRALESALSSEFPRIKDVSLTRPSLLATALIVIVEEREPYAKWCEASCYLLDASGFIFAESGGETPVVPYIFSGGLAGDRDAVGQWFLRGRLADSVRFFEALKAAGHVPTALTVLSEKDFRVTLENGVALYVPFDAAEDSIHNLETALDAESLRDRVGELEYIDLRFGNRVYFK